MLCACVCVCSTSLNPIRPIKSSYAQYRVPNDCVSFLISLLHFIANNMKRARVPRRKCGIEPIANEHLQSLLQLVLHVCAKCLIYSNLLFVLTMPRLIPTIINLTIFCNATLWFHVCNFSAHF